MSKMQPPGGSSKFHNFHSPFIKNTFFEQIENAPGGCHFGTPKCTLESYAKCSHLADLVSIAHAVAETLVYVAPNEFPLAKS